MNTLASRPRALSVHFDDDSMWVHLEDGRRLSVPIAYFPRLLKADSSERGKYSMTGGGAGIHWDDLDEDISVEGLLLGIGDRAKR